MPMRETAFAKINLALHVRARTADGYHAIETVFAFCEDGDTLEAEPATELSLEVSGPMADALAGENLVLAAANSLRNRCHAPGARLSLDKRLPVAAGLGGGSADAAAALRLLTRLWRFEVPESELEAIAAGLGADVPACLHSRTLRGEGKGDALTPVHEPKLAGTPVLLVNPGVALATGAVFAAWDGVDRGPLGDWREGRNDLEAAAAGIVPEIKEVFEALADAELARMSGSGATCFGLYPDVESRDRAAAAVVAEHPGWWLLATRLRA